MRTLCAIRTVEEEAPEEIPEEVPEAVFTNVGAFCTEGGILISKRWIPAWLLAAWEKP